MRGHASRQTAKVRISTKLFKRNTFMHPERTVYDKNGHHPFQFAQIVEKEEVLKEQYKKYVGIGKFEWQFECEGI